ncbi:Cyclic di-GMP phosphodiesterase Gmr [bacterium HR33]|nr:Cyclic di-GMP phosphodiesterase Gmr [bacterium HR33]
MDALRVLICSPDPVDLPAVEEVLRRAGVEPVWRRVNDRGELEAALSERWPDMVLARHPGSELDALQVLDLMGGLEAEAPLVVVAREWSDRLALECLKGGAADCVPADSPVSVALGVLRALQVRNSRKELARAREELGLTESRYRAIVEHALDAAALVDAEGVVKYISRASETVLGYPSEELINRPAFSVIHPDDAEAARRALQECLRHPDRTVRVEFRARHRDGSWRVIEAVAVNRLDHPGIGAVVVNYRDITERKQAEAVLATRVERLSLAARGANDGLWDWDLVRNTVYYSPRWKEMLGYGAEEIGDSPEEWLSRVHSDDLPHLKALVAAHLEGRTARLEVEYRLRHRSGEYRWMLCRGLAARDSTGKAYRIAGVQTDITDRKAAELELLEQVTRDPLTGLANRAYFLTVLGRAVERSRKNPGYRFALVFVDLDDFKRINDTYGHLIGDQCLVVVGRRLESSVRPGDVVARLGGDEFTVLLDGVSDAADVRKVVRRIQETLSSPWEVGGYELKTTASIGVALAEGQYADAGEVLHAADRAMYRVKAGGGAGLKLAEA